MTEDFDTIVIPFFRKRGMDVIIQEDGSHVLTPSQEIPMTILDTIKKDRLTARKEQNRTASDLLTTLLSEISMIGKNDGNRETTDDEAVTVLKKFIKNANETIDALNDEDPRRAVSAAEIAFIERYLPQQLSEDELRDIIAPLIEGKTVREMGSVMKELKENYAGLFDGAVASRIVKEQLQG